MKAGKPLTGRHVAMIFGGCFSIIIAVNLALAFSAVSTFPGLEVRNSYVASQHFEQNRDAQEALGWTVTARAGGGLLALHFNDASGAPVRLSALEATVGRATHVRDDLTPEFVFDGDAYVARATLAAGYWNVRLTAQAEDGTTFRQRIAFRVREEDI